MSHFQEPPATQGLGQHQPQMSNPAPPYGNQPMFAPMNSYHQVYNPTGTNFFMHKYDYNPRLLFDNLQNMVEKTAPNLQTGDSSQTTRSSLARQSSLDNLTLSPLDQDLARIRLSDIDTSSVDKDAEKHTTSQIDDLNRIEIDTNSISMFNDMSELLAIINDPKDLAVPKEAETNNGW